MYLAKLHVRLFTIDMFLFLSGFVNYITTFQLLKLCSIESGGD